MEHGLAPLTDEEMEAVTFDSNCPINSQDVPAMEHGLAPLTDEEMEAVTVVFHQFETGLREGTIYTKVRVHYFFDIDETELYVLFYRHNCHSPSFLPFHENKGKE